MSECTAYRCDRCGATADDEEWAKHWLRLSPEACSRDMLDLCEKCKHAFDRWMQEPKP